MGEWVGVGRGREVQEWKDGGWINGWMDDDWRVA